MTFQTLSLLVPVRGHEARRRRMWDSLVRTAWASPLELVLRVDDDEVGQETFDWAATLEPTPVILRGPRRDGYKSLPIFFNEMAAVASGDVLMCGNDDIEFMTPDWVEAILAHANRYPDGLFNIGTYTFPAGSFPFSCVSKRLVERLGFLNDERLVFSDIFLRDVAARLGRLVLLPDVIIMHVGTADADAFETKADVHANATAYWTLHEQCVAEAVAALRRAA